MPEVLQPLLTHLCVARGPDRIQQPVLDRAQVNTGGTVILMNPPLIAFEDHYIAAGRGCNN